MSEQQFKVEIYSVNDGFKWRIRQGGMLSSIDDVIYNSSDKFTTKQDAIDNLNLLIEAIQETVKPNSIFD